MDQIKQIHEVFPKSQITLGEALSEIEKNAGLAIDVIGGDKVMDQLQECSRKIIGMVNTHKWREEISKKKEYLEVSAANLKSYMFHQYKQIFGLVTFSESQIEVIDKISAILSRDIEECNRLGIDINKGAMLYGGNGVGKSSIMKAFSSALMLVGDPEYPSFRVKACLDIANEYKDEGAICINRHSNLINTGLHKKSGWYFDDLGTENKAFNFGNVSNPLEEILQICYNKKELRGKVHGRTNLSSSDIEGIYGKRIVSRFKEMFNIIKFDVNEPDYRTT